MKGLMMKQLLCLMALALPLAALAQAHDAAAIAKDVQRHRAMAAAHEAAARCLESGKKYEACQKELQAACKGLALGKNCGMRHEH